MPDDELDGLHLKPLDGLHRPDVGNPIAEFTFTKDGWTASGTIKRTPQGLVVSRLEITPDEDGPGITMPMLRSVPVREILAEARWLNALVARHPAARRRGSPDLPTLASPPVGRAPITDEFLRRVALDYLDETAPGQPRGAISRLTTKYGKSTPTVSRWVGKARDAGWLGPAVPGREGGEPGPRLLARAIPGEVVTGEPEQAGE